MKNSITKFLFFFLFFGLIDSFVKAQSVTKSVPIHFSVTNTVINRFIADQWSSTTTIWTGSYQGMNYTIDLDKPIVILSDNTIKIDMEMHVYATFMGSTLMNEDLSISPEISVNPNGGTEDIRAQYENLVTVINNAPIPDSRIKYVIREKLKTIDWVLYEGGILNVLSGRITDTSDLEWENSIGFNVQVLPGELLFTVTPALVAIFPEYSFRFLRANVNNFSFEVISNNKITIQGINMYSSPNQWGPISRIYSGSFNSTSVYDTITGKYIASVGFSLNPVSSFLYQFKYRVLIKRQNNEVAWLVDVAGNGYIGEDYGWATYSGSSLVGE